MVLAKLILYEKGPVRNACACEIEDLVRNHLYEINAGVKSLYVRNQFFKCEIKKLRNASEGCEMHLNDFAGWCEMDSSAAKSVFGSCEINWSVRNPAKSSQMCEILSKVRCEIKKVISHRVRNPLIWV